MGIGFDETSMTGVMRYQIAGVSTRPPHVTHPGSSPAGFHRAHRPPGKAAPERRDGMSATLIRTCPLCGLRFDNLPIFELHIREDHRRQERRPAQDDGDCSGTGGPDGQAKDG